MLCPEEIQRKNVIKAEKLLTNRHGELTVTLQKSLDKIKSELDKYEVGSTLLDRISDTMHEATYMENIEDAEKGIKYLADTFWDQIY